MTGKEIVKDIMDVIGIGVAELGKRSGNSTQNIWVRLNANDTKDLTLTSCSELCKAMGYKIVIVPEQTKTPAAGYEYTPPEKK